MNIGERKLNLLMDLYQLTMSQGYFNEGLLDTQVVFDMFFRKIPNNGGYVIVAGLEQVVEYIQKLSFDKEEIESLRAKGIFNDDFLRYLKDFKFKGDIYAIPEGTVVFPHEPLVTVVGNPIEAQLIETMVLLTINHQSLIATKASRIVNCAKGRSVLEFGARRSQGYDGAVYGARASYIGGVDGTATTLATPMFNIPSIGTMAHSWIQLFDDEYKAFETYAKNYPSSCTLLIDTYDVINSGIPNAIKVAKEVLEPLGHRLKGVRIDSGDMTYLSNVAREMFDKEGMYDCKIVASSSLDEYTISALLAEGAKIDSFGVGERLITSKSEPVFGGVYKIVAVNNGNGFEARIKISENVEKVTNPGYKEVWRLYDNDTNKALADVITLKDEFIDNNNPYEIFDPVHTWKKQILTNFTAKKLQVPVFINGELVYELPTVEEIKAKAKKELNTLWDEVKRIEKPHRYYVDLSKDLWNLKNNMLFSKGSKMGELQ